MERNIQSSDEYKQLTSALEILEQQRKTRENDIESLKTLFKQSINDPIQFVESLIEGKIQLPGKQPIHQVPIIEITSNGKIIRSPPPSQSSSMTTPTKQSLSSSLLEMTPIKIPLLLPTSSSSSNPSSPPSSSSSSKKKRPFTEKETESHMKPWSSTEQEKLNSLLLKYPEEEIATHRWKKIADDLGSRTPKQVASRVQKYFVKLTKMGLPVPGKPPNAPSLFPKPSPKKKHMDDESYVKSKSSKMDGINRSSSRDDRDMDNERKKKKKLSHSSGSTSSSSSTSNPLKSSSNSIGSSSGGSSTSNTLKSSSSSSNSSTKKKSSSSSSKSSSSSSSSSSSTSTTKNNNNSHRQSIIHEGYKCDGCDQEPIVGYRYKCEECIEDIDLCQSCHDSYEKIGSHKSSHHMICYKTPAETDYYLDSDYKFSYGGGTSNYLDPNYQNFPIFWDVE
ncbi:myb domain-containing protein [Cavenderia fasciculata]|uniref:Myb domain-containing protein n=1 Tax=Cavenderia fasciculata TaxID=261658 RepID=F4Q2D2_CACFS|nr:myb domain-containing protein [Cavenderia fasciculata]EGG18152.1 myb domain-containing protein [Cavenderia fasciculata]|eukprot:XP_004366193.1 myb domain-containing protein [Cavenderia fasciculata]